MTDSSVTFVALLIGLITFGCRSWISVAVELWLYIASFKLEIWRMVQTLQAFKALAVFEMNSTWENPDLKQMLSDRIKQMGVILFLHVQRFCKAVQTGRMCFPHSVYGEVCLQGCCDECPPPGPQQPQPQDCPPWSQLQWGGTAVPASNLTSHLPPGYKWPPLPFLV